MSYILSNGHTYISKKPNGKFVATYDAGLAITFDSEQKAWKALNQLPRGYKEAGYLPKQLNEPQKTNQEKDFLLSRTPANSTADKRSFVKVDVKDSEWMTVFKQDLLTVAHTLGNLKKNYAKAYEELNKACDEIEDIIHAMELKNVNACKANKLEVEMRNARRRRRECKNAMALMEMAMRFELDDWGSGEIEDAISRMNNCAYHPKTRLDLFE